MGAAPSAIMCFFITADALWKVLCLVIKNCFCHIISRDIASVLSTQALVYSAQLVVLVSQPSALIVEFTFNKIYQQQIRANLCFVCCILCLIIIYTRIHSYMYDMSPFA